MTRAELIDAVAAETGEAKKAVAAVIAATLVEIQKSNKVTLVGFGTFQRKTRAARVGRNPHTGEPLNIPAKTAMVFKASKQ